MTVRTVAVLLTGSVTPYTTAMRTAARTTTTTASSITAAMRTASARSSAALTGIGRTAQVQAARAGTAYRTMATRASADMTRMAARTSAATRAALGPIPGLTARAGAGFTTLGARGSAAFTTISTTATRAAGVLGRVVPAAVTRAGAAFPGLAARASAAAAAVSARWSTTAAFISSRWSAAMATMATGGTAVRAAAGTTTSWISARWSAAAAFVSSRWSAASAAVVAASAAARTGAGSAATWVAGRWTAAGAAMSRAMGAARLAAYAAGAGMLAAGTGAKKSLDLGRKASLGLVAAFGLAAFAAARFDKSMSEVRAVTNGSAGDMKRLGQAALDAGQITKYSATEAANAEAELARAGVSTADIVGGALKGSLDLAASGQLELGESAIISAQAMNAFKLEGRDVGHIADVISAGAGKSATNVHDLGMAFRQAALLSSQTGLSLEQTVGTLSLFAQNALTGSDAGTSLKTMLQRLTPQSKEAQAAMDKIGFSAYDAQGNFVGLSKLAGNMQSSFSTLTPEARNAAMGVIFGSDAVRAATILYEAGAGGVDKWVKSVDDQGYATRVAATMTDNLSGDLERLKGALETALIQSGSSANVVLRDMAQVLTSVVNWYGNLSPEVQGSVTAMAGVVGVAGLIGTSLLLLLPRVMTVRRELVALGVTGARTRTMLGGLGRVGGIVAGIAAIAYGVSELKKSMAEAPPSTDKLANSLLTFGKNGKAGGEVAKAFGKDLGDFGEAVKQIAHPSVQNRLDHMTESFKLLDDSDLGFGGDKPMELSRAHDLIGSLDTALTQLVQSGATDQAAQNFNRFAAEAEKGGTSTEKFRSLLPGYTDALASVDTQGKLAAGSQKDLGDATATTADEMKDTRTEAEKLTDALNTLNGVNISAAEKEISFRQSVHDLNEAVKENGHSLDVTSEAGRKVKGAYLDAAKAAMDHAAAVADQKGSVEAGNAVLEQDIAVLKRSMKAAGFTETQIRQLTSAYSQLPATADTTVSAETQGALKDLDAVKAKIASTKGKSVTVNALTTTAEAQLTAFGFKVTHMKNGQVKITLPTGGPLAAVGTVQRAIDNVRDGSARITVTTSFRTSGRPPAGPMAGGYSFGQANGGTVDYFAGGSENHVAQIAPGGSWRVWGEPETQGEGYVPFAPSKRGRSRKITEEIVRRLGGKGVAWHGDGGVQSFASGGFTYTPTAAPAFGGTGDPRARFDSLVGQLRDAWAEYQTALKDLAKVKKNKKATSAQRHAAQAKVNDEYADVKALDKSLGLKAGAKAPTTLSLAAYTKQLNTSLSVTEKWRSNLNKIGARGGAEVQSMLQDMGEGGYALVNLLVKASDKQFKDVTSKLLKTGEIAKATLADLTSQLSASTKEGKTFAADLQTLAAKGFGDLAQALASQGDSSAMTLAHQAATGSAKDATAANAAVKGNNAVLSGDDLTNALVLLSTLRAGPGRGYAELVAAGLDTGVIKALVPRMLAQINSLPAANKGKFLQQYAGQGGTVAMAAGGILRAPTVIAGERGTESYIPINGSARSQALLETTGRLMGYRMTPASRYGNAPAGGRQIVRQGDRHATVHLYGAKQTSGEQALDVARHMQLIG